MKTLNKTVFSTIKNKTEEFKFRDQFNRGIRDKIIQNNKNRFYNNPIRILNNRSTFQIKPKKEKNSSKINSELNKFYEGKNSNYIPLNLRKSKNFQNDNNEGKDNLILQLYHITKDLNNIDNEIKELQGLFNHEEKENMAHKFIIQKILNTNY